MFKKATAVQSPFKATLYGPPGSGKTFTALLFSEGLAAFRKKRIAYIDTEYSTKTYRQAVPARRVHPEAFDFDVLDTRSLSETLKALKSLDTDTYGVVVLDSISRLWDAAKEAYTAKNPSSDDIPLRAWGSIKRPYKEMMQLLIQNPCDVLILGRQKTIFGNEDGELRNIGVGMRAEGESQYEPDVCFRMELVGRRGEEEGIVTMFAEKDRYGILSGRTYSMPTFKTLEPLVPYLGTEAPKSQTDDEAAEIDSDLLDAQEDKARAKSEKSSGILADMQAKLQAAQTIEALGAIAAEVKKLKRYMTEEHTNALRVLFESRRDNIVAETAGGV